MEQLHYLTVFHSHYYKAVSCSYLFFTFFSVQCSSCFKGYLCSSEKLFITNYRSRWKGKLFVLYQCQRADLIKANLSPLYSYQEDDGYDCGKITVFHYFSAVKQMVCSLLHKMARTICIEAIWLHKNYFDWHFLWCCLFFHKNAGLWASTNSGIALDPVIQPSIDISLISKSLVCDLGTTRLWADVLLVVAQVTLLAYQHYLAHPPLNICKHFPLAWWECCMAAFRVAQGVGIY